MLHFLNHIKLQDDINDTLNLFLDPNKVFNIGSGSLFDKKKKPKITGETDFYQPGQQISRLGMDAPVEEEIQYNLGVGDYLWDIAAGTGSGFIQGLTFGLVDLYEEKTAAGKVASTFADIAGIMLPFGQINKAHRLAMQLGKRSTTRTVKASAEKAMNKARAAGLAKEHGNAVIRHIENATYNVTTGRYTGAKGYFDLGVDKAARVVDDIGVKVRAELSDAFTKMGHAPGRGLNSKKTIDEIADAYVNGLREGNHINTVGAWISNKLPWLTSDNRLKKGIAKYLAMATDEVIAMNIYGHISGTLNKAVHGDEYDPGMSTIHSTIIGAGFPALRAIGGGGKETWKKWFDATIRRYETIDYKALAKKGKDGRTMLRSLIEGVSGGMKNSPIKNMDITLKGGKKINLATPDVLKSLDGEDLVIVANAIRKHIVRKSATNHLFKVWGPDFLKSSGRMALGGFFNNSISVATGEYWHLPAEDKFSHWVLGMFFTRGRGHWNHSWDPHPAVSDYYRVANTLSGGISGMEKMAMYLDHIDVATRYGAAANTNSSMRHIYEIMEKYRDQEGVDQASFNPTLEHKMQALSELHYAMDLYNKAPDNPSDFIRFDWTKVPKDARKRMLEELDGLRVSTNDAGKNLYFRDLDMPTFHDIIKMQVGDANLSSYTEFLQGLKEFGIPVSISSDGTLQFPSIHIPDSFKETHSFGKLSGLFEYLSNLGKGVKTDRTIDISEVFKDEAMVKRFDEYVERHKELLLTDNYGESMATHMPNFDYFSNDLLRDISSGLDTRALMKLYDMFHDNVGDLSSGERNFVSELGSVFLLRNKVVQSFRILREGKEVDFSDPDITVTSASGTTDMAYVEQFLQLHDMYGKGKSKSEHKQSIEMDVIKRIVDQYVDLINPPMDHMVGTGSTLSERYTDYIGRRMMGEYISPEKFYIFDQLKSSDEIWYDAEAKVFHISSGKAKGEQVYESSKDRRQSEKAQEMWEEILDFLGTANGKIVITDKVYAETVTPQGGTGSQVDNLRRISELHESIAPSYREQINTLISLYKETTVKNPETGEIDKTRSVVYEMMENVKKEIDAFAKGERVDLDKVLEDTKNILLELNKKAGTQGEKNLVNDIIKTVVHALKNRKSSEEAMTEVVNINGDPMNLALAFKTMIETDVNGMNKLNNLVISLMGLTESPHSRMDALRLQLKLKKELAKRLGIDLKLEEVDILTLINKAKNDMSFSSVRDLIDSVKNSIAQSKTIENTQYDEALYKQKMDFLDKSSFKPDRMDLATLAKHFSIDNIKTGEPVDIDILQSINTLRELHVKDQLNNSKNYTLDISNAESVIKNKVINRINNASDLSTSEKAERIQEFEKSGFFELYNMVATTVSRPRVSYKSGEWVFESDVPMTRGQRDRFIDDLNKAGVDTDKIIEVNEAAIAGGQSVTISTLDANNLLKQSLGTNAIDRRVQQSLKEGRVPEEGDLVLYTPIDLQNAKVIHLGPGSPFMIEASPEMLKSVGDLVTVEFNKMLDQMKVDVNNASGQLKRQLELSRQNFKEFFQDMVNTATTRSNIEHKMTLLYWSKANRPMFLEQFAPDVFGRKETMQAFYDKFYKRLKLFEGGGFKQTDRSSLANLARNHPDSRVRKQAQKELDDGIMISTMKDEAEGSQFLAKDSIIESLEAQKAGETNPDIIASIDKMINDIRPDNNGLYESLDGTSKLNSITYIGEGRARIMAALEGKEFDPSVVNGYKPIIQYTDPNTNQAVYVKTWMVYDPKNSKIFKDKNIDIMTTESGAKYFRGVNQKGEMATMFEPATSDWRTELRNADAESISTVSMTPESVLMGFGNHKNQGVALSNATFNFLDSKAVVAARSWQGFESLMAELSGTAKDLMVNTKREIADVLYEWKQEQDGYSIMSPQQSLAEALLGLGLRTDSSLTKSVVHNFFASKALNLLRRPRHDRGTSTYLATDILPKANREKIAQLEADLAKYKAGSKEYIAIENQVAAELAREVKLDTPVYKQWDNVDNKGVFRHIEGRDKIRLGGHAESYEYGEIGVQDISRINFVARIGGVDVPFTIHEGKVKAINIYDSYFRKEFKLDNNKQMMGDRNETRKKLQAEIDKHQEMMELVVEYFDEGIKIRSDVGKIKDIYSFLRALSKGTFKPKDKKYKKLAKFIKDNKVELLSNVQPIPRKGTDFTSVRVQHILAKEFGNHSQINHYDLAVTLQRDFDADHLYGFTDTPYEVLKHTFFMEGTNADVMKYSTTPADFNPFGADFGASRIKAGQSLHSNGIQQFKLLHEQKKMAMGRMISYVRPLAQLDNLGFRIGVDPANIGKYEKLNFVPREGNNQNGIIARLENVTQATVDAFGGEKQFLKLIKNLDDFILFGIVPDKVKIPPELYDHKPIFKQDKQTPDFNPQVYRDIVKEVLTILKRSDNIFNDVYDQGMPRKIDAYDIRIRHRELRRLFGDNANEYIMRRLLNKYAKDHQYQTEIIKVFLGRGYTRTYKDADILAGFKKDLLEGKDLAIQRIFKLNDYKNAKGNRDMDKYFESSNSTLAMQHLNQNKFFYREDSANWPGSEKTKSEILNDSKVTYRRIQMLRVLGLEPGSITGDNFFVENMNKKFLTPGDMIGHNKRNVAYSYYAEKYQDLNKRLYWLSGQKNANINEVTELQNKMADYAIAMNAIEQAAMREFGAESTKNFVGNSVFDSYVRTGSGEPGARGVSEPTTYTNRSKGWHHVYKINRKSFNPRDSKQIESLSHGFDGSKGMQFIGSIRAGDTWVLQPNSNYVVLKRPLIAKYISEPKTVEGYSWYLATADADLKGIISPEGYDRLAQDIIDYKREMSHEATKQYQRFMDPNSKVYSREGQMEKTIADSYNTARLFKTYALDKDVWNQDKVDRLAIVLLSPDPLPRAYVAGDNSVSLPYFRFNTRLAKSVLLFLKQEGLADGVITDRIQYQSALVDYISRGIDPSYIDAPWRESKLDFQEYYKELEGFGEGREFIVDILSDNFSPFQHTMSEFLASRYIFQRTNPHMVNILGGQIEPKMRVMQLKDLKGTISNTRINRINFCE